MKDVVEKLRSRAPYQYWLNEVADEIERLRAELAKYEAALEEIDTDGYGYCGCPYTFYKHIGVDK